MSTKAARTCLAPGCKALATGRKRLVCDRHRGQLLEDCDEYDERKRARHRTGYKAAKARKRKP